MAVTFDPATDDYSADVKIEVRYDVGSSQNFGDIGSGTFVSTVQVDTTAGQIKFDDYHAGGTVTLHSPILTQDCDAFDVCTKSRTATLRGTVVLPDITDSTDWLDTTPPAGFLDLPALFACRLPLIA